MSRPGRRAFLVGLMAVLPAIILSLPSVAHSAESEELSVSVMDFTAAGAASWLGPALAESLRSALSMTDGCSVLDRERSVAGSSRRGSRAGESEPAADVVMTGRAVVLNGARGVVKVEISISRKSRVAPSIAVSGSLADVGKLQTDLILTVGQALGLDAKDASVDALETTEMAAYKLFGQGLLKLRAAEKITGKKPEALQRATRRSAGRLLKDAASCFADAQKANGGYFGSAHVYEGVAGALAARVEPDPKKADQLEALTVAKYRKDAKDSSLALFDLGRVLQASMKYEEAAAVYEEYLKLNAAEFKTEAWETPWYSVKWISLPDLVGPNVPGTINYGLYYPSDKHFFVVQGRDVVAHAVADGVEQWRSTMPEDLHYPYVIGREDYLVVLTGQNLVMLDTADGKMLYQRGSLNLPRNTFDEPYAMNYIGIPEGERPEYLVVFRESLAFKEAPEVEACMFAIDVKQDAELWRISWSRPYGSALNQESNTDDLRTGNTFARVSEMVKYPQLVQGVVSFKEYRDGGLVAKFVDARTGRDAASRVNPAVRKHLSEGYLYEDGKGGGWIPGLERDKAGTVAFCSDLKAAPKVTVDSKVRCADTVSVLWKLFRPKQVFGFDPQTDAQIGTPTVVYDSAAKAFRPVVWPWRIIDDNLDGHGHGVHGDLLLLGTQENNRPLRRR